MITHRELYFHKVSQAHEKGKIGDDVLKVFFEKLPVLERAISSVEKAFGLNYPPVAFDPNLIVVKYPSGLSETVIYASTQIQRLNGSYRLCVELTLPFLLYSKEDLLRACLAHEFLHYIFITITLSRKSLESLPSEKPIAPEIHLAFDETHTVKAEDWIKDDDLLGQIKRYFNPLISDVELEESIKKNWISRKLPIREITAEENMLRVPILEVDKIPIDQKIVELSSMRLKIGR